MIDDIKELERLEARTRRQIASQMRIIRKCQRDIKRLKKEARERRREEQREAKRQEAASQPPVTQCEYQDAWGFRQCRNKARKPFCGIHDPNKPDCANERCLKKALKGRNHCAYHIPEFEWSHTLYDTGRVLRKGDER